MIGLVLAIGLSALPQEIDDLSPQTMQAVGAWQECLDSNAARVSQSSDTADVAADRLLDYCRDQQSSARAALAADLNRNGTRDGEELTNSTETILVMRARQNILGQIAAARQQ